MMRNCMLCSNSAFNKLQIILRIFKVRKLSYIYIWPYSNKEKVVYDYSFYDRFVLLFVFKSQEGLSFLGDKLP